MSTPEDPGEKLRRLTESSEAETQASPPSGDVTPVRRMRTPTIDSDGMPLPQRVDESDRDGTRVSPAALSQVASSNRRRPKTGSERNIPGKRAHLTARRKRLGGCLLRGFVISLFLIVGLAVILLAGVIYKYYDIASELPPVSDLRDRASQFETTRILDRFGSVLYEINDPSAGRRTYKPLTEISPNLVAATIAIEDKDFYTHKGFDPFAILRAFWQNLQSGETVSGASTITQQLARALLFSPEERVSQTYMRKVREAILAAEVERRYTKDQILELYINEIYYGNLSYGIEAASQAYFRKSANKLSLGEATFLAGLPQAPSVYDVYTQRDTTLVRFQSVLLAMMALSNERGCIYVSNSPSRVCVDGGAAAIALQEIEGYSFVPPTIDMRYPHWVQYIRTALEAMYPAQTIYRSGFSVYTTLDPTLQDQAQQMVTDQVASLTDLHVTGGALVAIKPSTGEILAMVGSPDFYNEANSGQVNMAVSPTRQPGSSIKPVTYLAAFEKGWTPATLIWDVPSEFPPSGLENDPNPPYIPSNYSHNFWGPVTVRTALANSLNVPAVKALNFAGIYDDPDTPQKDGMVAMAERLGITSLTRSDYGLSLTLGGGEVSLLEMTGAFSVIANSGVRVPPVAISKIVDFQGKLVYEYNTPPSEQVISPQHAFLITSILSDRVARAPVFGYNSILNLPFTAAVKTGTSNDARDNWTIGFTPDLAVGVWVGNPDYTPMENTTGVTGAGPAWAQFMTYAVPYLTNNNPTAFIRPGDIVEQTICTVSGTQPSPWCPERREEYFFVNQPALTPDHDLWQEILLDTWTSLLASPECSDFTETKLVLNVTEEWAVNWIRQEEKGQQWARDMGFDPVIFIPERKCTAGDPRPHLEFIGLSEGMTITESPFVISFVVQADNGYDEASLEYDLGFGWITLTTEMSGPSYSWDLVGIPAGPVSLRLHMTSNDNDGFSEKTIHLILMPPTPTTTTTPTSTPTPTGSPTETPPERPTEIPTPSETPTP